jgi:hypothetical protein
VIETSAGCATARFAVPEIEPDVAVIVVVPIPVPVASPELSIVATTGAEEVQLTGEVRSWVLLSEYVPVAVNCWFVPSAMDALDGETEIETRTGAVTVSGTEALIEPTAAVILAAPCVRPEASPAALTVATAGADDFQVTEPVRSSMVPSL